MSSSNVGANTYMNQNGVQGGGQLNYNGVGMSYQNPGLMDPSQLNPSAAGQIQGLQGLEGQVAQGMPSSAWYGQMRDTDSQHLMTSLGNQYASMGLSGSSAEMGAMSQAGINNNNAWMSRQLSDSQSSAKTQAGLMQQGYQDTMGIQNQYGGFEDAYNQSIANLLGAQQQQQQSNQALGGQIAGSVLGAAGTMGAAAI